MKKFFACVGVAALLGAGCSSQGSAMPDEFYAHGSWRFDADESVINFGVKGIAFLDLHFTRETGDQYLIEGTVTYDDASLTCDIYPRFTICPVNTCDIVSTTVGEITGVAEVRGDKLVMQPRWVTKPDEAAKYSCSDAATTTNSGWAVWQTMGPLGAGIMEGTWEVSVAGAFIDDLPTDVATDVDTISASFTTEANDVTAEGLIGFYREQPE